MSQSNAQPNVSGVRRVPISFDSALKFELAISQTASVRLNRDLCSLAALLSGLAAKSPKRAFFDQNETAVRTFKRCVA